MRLTRELSSAELHSSPNGACLVVVADAAWDLRPPVRKGPSRAQRRATGAETFQMLLLTDRQLVFPVVQLESTSGLCFLSPSPYSGKHSEKHDLHSPELTCGPGILLPGRAPPPPGAPLAP